MAARKGSKPAAETGDTQVSFEQQLAELEEIVRQLEDGEKPLDESLALYEKGVTSLKACHAILDRAEKRIKVLVQHASGEPALEDASGGATGTQEDDGEALFGGR